MERSSVRLKPNDEHESSEAEFFDPREEEIMEDSEFSFYEFLNQEGDKIAGSRVSTHLDNMAGEMERFYNEEFHDQFPDRLEWAIRTRMELRKKLAYEPSDQYFVTACLCNH